MRADVLSHPGKITPTPDENQMQLADLVLSFIISPLWQGVNSGQTKWHGSTIDNVYVIIRGDSPWNSNDWARSILGADYKYPIIADQKNLFHTWFKHS
jgi:hypothetical protein